MILLSTILAGSQISFSKTRPISVKKRLTDEQRIQKMILAVQPEIDKKELIKISAMINRTAKKNKIDPKIMISIIDTESDFKHYKISTTGDISIAQINPKVWEGEFERLKLGKLDVKKLQNSKGYAIVKMGQILQVLQKNYAKRDKNWYARYHSKTEKYKTNYAGKVDMRLRKIASI